MAGISGRTGFVTVSGSAVCAYNWTYESALSNPEENRIETTTFCSSAREYVIEDSAAEVQSSITYETYAPVPIALIGAAEDVSVGNASCTYTIASAVCTQLDCTCPIDGVLTSSVTWEKTESA